MYLHTLGIDSAKLTGWRFLLLIASAVMWESQPVARAYRILCYVATVQEVVASASEDQWVTSAQESGKGWNVFEAAARCRQSLAVSTSVGRQRLAILRTRLGLAPVGLAPPKPDKAVLDAPKQESKPEAELAVSTGPNPAQA